MSRDVGDVIAVKMLLYRWLTVSAKENKPYLPDPDREEWQNKVAEDQEVNKKVLVELGKKRPSSHHRYDPELRVKIGRFAASSGSKAAVDKYSKELGRPESESTVCSMKKAYYFAVQQRKDEKPVTRQEQGL